MTTTPTARRLLVVLGLLVFAMASSGCVYDAILGKSTAAGGYGTEHPCDGVLVAMIRSVEERRPDQFSQHIDVAANPSRDQLWLALTNFLNRADAVEYVVTVERRYVEGIKVTYTFAWTLKFEEKSTSDVVTTNGRSEWVFLENLGAFTLISATGTPLF